MIEALAIGVVLTIPLAVMPVMAQTMKPDPGPEEERMPAMMRMMREMHRDMERMRGEMRGDGMRGMHERMGGMTMRMERMTRMLERHQQRLESGCPALAPKDPKGGG
jgi:hypothetical protein